MIMLMMTRTQEVWMTIRTDSNAEMTRTIEKMEESDIRAIVSIFQTAFVHEYSLVKKRQLDYSVEAFKRTFPSINSSNLGKMERKIKDARCFFMILQEIHTSRTVRLLARSAQNNLFIFLVFPYVCIL